jgi:hypothetical protein
VTTYEVLTEAINILEHDGWGQGAYHLADGCHCALGAIGLAAGYHANVRVVEDDDELYVRFDDGGGEAFEAYSAANRALKELLPAGYDEHVPFCYDEHVPFWNDAPGRTKEQVLEKLREAQAAAA